MSIERMKLLIIITALILVGCEKEKQKNEITTEIESKDSVEFYNGYFKRMRIDGVDCIIASGRRDSSVAITCDWNNKDF
jgi:hypothetical protein